MSKFVDSRLQQTLFLVARTDWEFFGFPFWYGFLLQMSLQALSCPCARLITAYHKLSASMLLVILANNLKNYNWELRSTLYTLFHDNIRSNLTHTGAF